ncbi:hypothetical protein KC957_01940, partial [Candidatus Saccharibacteria bacterium]|nr:hypothetical protein [Candidatus Saccharibacteria bacterium]
EFLQRHGLLAGEIDFTGKHKPSLPGVLRVPVQEVSDLVSELSPNDEAEYMSVDSSVVGTQEFLVEASLV